MENNSIDESERVDTSDEILNLTNAKSFEQLSQIDQTCNFEIDETGTNDLLHMEMKETTPIMDNLSQENIIDEDNDHAEPNPLLLLSNKEFASREELQDSIKKISLEQGYVAVIKKSKPQYYVIVGCDRGGSYRRAHVPVEQRKRKTGTRLINCSFEIWGKRKGTIWRMEIKSLVHNHEPSRDMLGHPVCRRFSTQDMKVIRTISMAGSAPREILTTLRQSNSSLDATSRTMYNARAKIKSEELNGRTTLEALFEELGEGGFYYDIERDGDGNLTHLFFSHPNSMVLTKNFSSVFVMDCTYKTNKYLMPLLNIIGVSSFNTSFYSCFIFLQKEEEEDYIWALERFRKIMGVNNHPVVIVTDRELALMNAINVVFPQTNHLLCVWHVQKNVLAKCKKFFGENEDLDEFLSTWTNVIYSLDEQKFDEEWHDFEEHYNNKQSAIEYIKNNWLPYKEKFVLAWTEKHLHFGNHVTSRAEGAHAILKKYLNVSTGNLREVKTKICLAIANQFKEVKVMLESERIRISHDFRLPLFQKLVGKVSKHALEKLLEQYKLAISSKPLDKCRGHFQSTMGLPCAHKLIDMLSQKLELDDIHPQWRIDGRVFDNIIGGSNQDEDQLDSLLKDFQNKFKKMPLVQKEDTRMQISQIVDVSLPLIVNDPKINPRRGRPCGSKKRKNDSSTQRDSSEFEIVEKGRKCGSCGRLGHNMRTCAQSTGTKGGS